MNLSTHYSSAIECHVIAREPCDRSNPFSHHASWIAAAALRPRNDKAKMLLFLFCTILSGCKQTHPLDLALWIEQQKSHSTLSTSTPSLSQQPSVISPQRGQRDPFKHPIANNTDEADETSIEPIAAPSALHTTIITLNYAKAEALANTLKRAEHSVLSKEGNIAFDLRTNSLLIRDHTEQLAEIKRIIEVLDVPVRQVLIEARIVNAFDGFSKELGARLGLTYESGSIAFNLGRLKSEHLLDLELSALEKENKGNIIASPRLVTSNQQQAFIEAGEEIPFEHAAGHGITSVDFKKAVLSLKVTPQITRDRHIILELSVNQDTRGANTSAGPAVNTQQLSTQVRVSHGETIVLGGIYQTHHSKDLEKVPVLSDIPGVGLLFRKQARTEDKQELLIFVTPWIIEEPNSSKDIKHEPSKSLSTK